MKSNYLNTFRPIAVGTLTFIVLQLHLSAANAAWNVATGGNWTTAANWNPAAAPGNATSGATTNADIATFSNSAGGTINVDAGRTVRGINIGSLAGAYTFTGGPLYLSSTGTGGAIQNLNPGSAATQTIDMPVVVAAVGGTPVGLVISNRYAGSTNLLNFTSNATITSIASGSISLNLQGANTGNNTLGGVISDGTGSSTIGIAKREAGIWILNAANTYGGATTVIGGSLFINGNQSGATGVVTVGNGATLGGGGTIGGATTMNGGSLLVVGASTSTSIGSLEFISSLNLGGANTTLEIGGDLPAEYDRIDVTGTLTFGGTLTIADFMDFDISGQTAAYQLFGIGTSQSGDFAGVTVDSIALAQDSGVWSAEENDVSYAFNQSSGRLTVTVIPEPASALLGSFGLLGLLLRRRR